MNKKFPVSICPNTSAWCNKGDIWLSLQQILCLVPVHINTASSSYSHKTAYVFKRSWFHSYLPTAILYLQLTSVSLPDSEYNQSF